MIRVLVLYPREDKSMFDYNYYSNIHMPLVKKKLNPVKVEIDKGLPGASGPSPYFAVSHMIFNSRDELISGYTRYGKELNEDKNRFTDIEIITQISEIIEV